MSPVILLGLVVMWAVVLVPMWLRRHDEVEEARSVDRFTTAMHTLSRKDRESTALAKKYAVMPHRSSDYDVHVSGASADGHRPRRPVPSRQAAAVSAATRRRRTLVGLLVATLVTFVAAILLGGLPLWGLQVIVDLGLFAFVYHLRTEARTAAMVRPARRRPAPVAPPASRVEPVAVRMPTRRPAAEPLFDQTAEVDVYAAYESAADDGIFDQTAAYDEPSAPTRVFEFEPTPATMTDEFFDQDSIVERPVVERVAAEVAPRRDPEIDISISEPTAAGWPEAETGIGSRPWAPVPVPRPMYTTKPVAPPRSPRVPIYEPLLPPVETAAELDPVEDLEEILDRRWAVND